jgi:hypothetical protein
MKGDKHEETIVKRGGGKQHTTSTAAPGKWRSPTSAWR